LLNRTVLIFILSLGIANKVIAQLSAPTTVEAVALGQKHVRIYWKAAPNAAQYVIYRNGEVLGLAPDTSNQFDDMAAEPGTTYRYSVASVAAQGKPGPSNSYVERTFPLLPSETRCDVLVVGATTAGVAAAVTAARYGLNVVLIEETRRLGGMPVNGLGATDLRRIAHSSGFFEEFRRKVATLYGSGDGLKYEPRVAHQAIKEIVWGEPKLVVHRQVRPLAIKKQGETITEVTAEELPGGRRVIFRPKVIVDATECGDVAAWAGAPFRVGREPKSAREPHAGHLYYDRAGDKPLPGSIGQGDKRVQAYAYLMTVQDYGPDADKTIPMPPGYDPKKYEHAVPWDKSWAVSSGKLPNNKFEVNQHPQGSDLQGVNYDYPTTDYSERRRVENLYRDHALGYLYYETVEGKKHIGLSEDDYRDSDHWPQLLYIREARRFEADVVLDETDIDQARKYIRPNVIGIGDYPMDSHAVQPKTDWTMPDMGEGEFYLPQYTPWHQVPYGIMIPQRLSNVFVPTAVSATHVAYGTVRLEPVRMHFGEAAGVASYFCARLGLTPKQVPVRQIQAELLKHRTPEPGRYATEGIGGPGPNANPTLLYVLADVKPGLRKYRAIEWLAARGFYPTPPPAQRTAVSGLVAAPFGPDEPIPADEAARLLDLLRKRAQLSGDAWVPQEPLPPMSGSLSRAQAARLVAGFMGWKLPAGDRRQAHYADSPGMPAFADIEALYDNWIDSRLWDGMPEYSPEGKLYFRPEKPVTRAQFAEMIYLAAINFGPLWEDHPADRR
jgi:hypothetical protein